ncbi:Integrase zinc binding domain [Phytophthora infestans]|uniref:Integrase zinc binding domain n=1 Tax=Phytophthora infestans TaxID=4787 RepID=A0A8S9V337_PHYIN|nr:Integrase zinc binding domain [Phytophthora infestans]
MAEILQCQQSEPRPDGLALSPDTQGVLRVGGGQIWIPGSAGSLQLRLCIVGHFGAAGHRGMDTTRSSIAARLWWNDLAADVDFFVRRCLHCASVVGGPPIPRPLGEAMHAERPNELIHWDYLFMGASKGDDKYILVIKDDASKFVWFFTVPDAQQQRRHTRASRSGLRPSECVQRGSVIKERILKMK